jgi:hypothetical protein
LFRSAVPKKPRNNRTREILPKISQASRISIRQSGQLSGFADGFHCSDQLVADKRQKVPLKIFTVFLNAPLRLIGNNTRAQAQVKSFPNEWAGISGIVRMALT